jgi:hypothetical protein
MLSGAPQVLPIVVLFYTRRSHLCALLFAVASLTDFLDGYLARRWQAGNRKGVISTPFFKHEPYDWINDEDLPGNLKPPRRGVIQRSFRQSSTGVFGMVSRYLSSSLFLFGNFASNVEIFHEETWWHHGRFISHILMFPHDGKF